MSFDKTQCTIPSGTDRLPFVIRGKWGIMDRDGNVVLKPKYLYISKYNGKYARVLIEDHGWTYLNTDGTVLGPWSFDDCSDYEDECAIVAKSHKYGVMTDTGRMIVDFKYDFIYDKRDNVCAITQEGRSGLVNVNGESVTECKYDEIDGFDDNGWVRVRSKQEIVFLDSNGCTKYVSRHSRCEPFYDDMAVAGTDSKVGYIDRSGTWVIEPVFDDGIGASETLFGVKRELWGFVDATGEWVIPPQFENITPMKCGIAGVCINGKWGILGKDGEMEVDSTYDDVCCVASDLVEVILGEEHWYLRREKTHWDRIVPGQR